MSYKNAIILITSIIDTPNIPLSYINTRSVFSKKERYEQTKKTISSIKEFIPNVRLFLVEYSILTEEEHQYFIENVDFFYNIYDTSEGPNLRNLIHSHSKSMCEGTMTKLAIEYLYNNNIEFDSFFKISGRYWINNKFNYKLYEHNISYIYFINYEKTGHRYYASTCFYLLTKEHLNKWYVYLTSPTIENDYIKCIGYEYIFANFLNEKNIEYIPINNTEILDDTDSLKRWVGISGYISVCGAYVDF